MSARAFGAGLAAVALLLLFASLQRRSENQNSHFSWASRIEYSPVVQASVHGPQHIESSAPEVTDWRDITVKGSVKYIAKGADAVVFSCTLSGHLDTLGREQPCVMKAPLNSVQASKSTSVDQPLDRLWYHRAVEGQPGVFEIESAWRRGWLLTHFSRRRGGVRFFERGLGGESPTSQQWTEQEATQPNGATAHQVSGIVSLSLPTYALTSNGLELALEKYEQTNANQSWLCRADRQRATQTELGCDGKGFSVVCEGGASALRMARSLETAVCSPTMHIMHSDLYGHGTIGQETELATQREHGK